MYYQNQCEQFKRNTKKLWELINKTIGKTNDKSCIVKFIKNGDIYHYSSKSICNEFASYISSVGNEFYQKIPDLEKTISYYNNCIPFSTQNIFLKPTNELEVSRIIDALPCKKSSGFDNIDNTLLKDLKFELLSPLTICSTDL